MSDNRDEIRRLLTGDAVGLREMDESARRHLGKGILDCGLAEWERLVHISQDEATRATADLDRAMAANAEAVACGCGFLVPQHPDGSWDLGSAVVDHTCGRS